MKPHAGCSLKSASHCNNCTRRRTREARHVFPLDFEKAYRASMGHVQQLRNAARFLALQAHVRAHESDAAGVARAMRTLLSLARTLQQEPLLTPQLLKHAIISVAAKWIEQLLPYVDFTDEQLAMVQRERRRFDIAKGLRHEWHELTEPTALAAGPAPPLDTP